PALVAEPGQRLQGQDLAVVDLVVVDVVPLSAHLLAHDSRFDVLASASRVADDGALGAVRRVPHGQGCGADTGDVEDGDVALGVEEDDEGLDTGGARGSLRDGGARSAGDDVRVRDQVVRGDGIGAAGHDAATASAFDPADG